MKKLCLAFVAATLALSGCGAIESQQNDSATEQLIIVNSNYRVVDVDVANFRVGIALVDANPYNRQNWLKIKIDTKVSQRVNGVDRQLLPQQFLNVVRPGQVIRVHGGRDWDTTVVAHKIWF